MGSSRSKQGIRRKTITYLILVGIIPLMIGWVLVYVYGNHSIRNTIGTNFQDLAVETAHHVDQAVEAEVQRIRQIASVPVLIRRAAIEANRRYEGMTEETIQAALARDEEAWTNGASSYADVLTNETARFLIESREVAGDKIMGILLTDQYGAVLAATSQPRRYVQSQEVWWKEAQDPAGGYLYISDVVDAGKGTFAAQGDTLDLAVAIMDVTQTRVVGVLKICYRFDNLLALVKEIRIGQTGHAMLFSSDGTALICPILPRKAHRMDTGLLHMIVSDEPDWIVAEDDGHGGKETVIGFAPLKGLKSLRAGDFGSKTWHVFIRQHPSETFAPLRNLLLAFGGGGIVLVGILTGLGRYVGGKLAQPIQSLREGVSAIQQGDLSYHLSVKTGDEIESLAEAVNDMAAGLRASKAELEDCNRSLTERVNEQTKELSRQLQHMDAILSNMAEGLLILNSDSKVEFMNPAARTLYGENLGVGCADLFYGWDKHCTKNDHPCPPDDCPVEALVSGRSRIFQYETKDRDGRILEITMVPTASESGDRLILVLFRDATKETKLKQQLRLADKLATMGKMAGGIAHEINNPLGIIINRIECLEGEMRNQNGSESLGIDLAAIKNQASRISRITKSLLTCSRDSAMTRKTLNINGVIRGAIELIDERLRELDVTLTTDLAKDLPCVMGDKDKLETLLLNLLNNALEAVPRRRGAITVTTRRTLAGEKEGVEITVSDNGTGIPPDVLDKVFEPFFTTKPASKGSGLGLFLSYGVVKEHQGEITVSLNADSGCTFVVTLPAQVLSVREEEPWLVRF